MISVLVPVFNDADNIVDAIKSIMNQTYRDFEIIVIDDSSNDETVKKILQWVTDNTDKVKPGRFNIIKTKFRSGPFIAINEGILVSKGDYITILLSHDIFQPQKLEEQHKILKRRQSYMAIVCQAGYVDIRPKYDNITIMFRRKIIDKIGYFDSVMVDAENEFAHRILKVYGLNSIKYVNGVLYNVQYSETNNRFDESDYEEKYKKWHNPTKDNQKINPLARIKTQLPNIKPKELFMPYPLIKRPFEL